MHWVCMHSVWDIRIQGISRETETNVSFPIYSSKIYVNALNTMHSLWSPTQAGYCAVPGHEEKKKAVALCEVGQVCEGVNGWLCQQKWWDLIIPIAYELSEPPKKPVEGLQSQQLSHDPLSGSEYQTFVKCDLILCVLLVWISPIDQNHKNILVKLWSSCRRTLQCERKKTH